MPAEMKYRRDDYYPYGMVMNGRSQTSSADARYKFTGKEGDAEIGYDYFGARYYDYRTGRWLQVDPLAGKYSAWSPYNYALCNPLRNIDPNGMLTEDQIEEKKTKEEEEKERRKRKLEILKEDQAKKETDAEEKQVSPILREISNMVQLSDYLGWGGVVAFGSEFFSKEMAPYALYTKGFKVITTTVRYAKNIGFYTSFISTGLDLFGLYNNQTDNNQTGNITQNYINLGIDGLSFVSPPLGVSAFIFDKTIGFRETYSHAGKFHDLIYNGINRIYMPRSGF